MQEWQTVKFGRYFVQFIVWVGIPSSLPLGTDVVPKRRASEDDMGITCLEETGVLGANLSAFVLFFYTDVTRYPIENYIIVVIIQIIIFK